MNAFRAALRKEIRQEGRARSGFAVTALFALVAGVVASGATYSSRPDPLLLAGLLWIILIFAAAVTLPRAFLSEDESGTGELLRLVSPPGATFLAKAALASGQMLVVSAIATATLLVPNGSRVSDPLLLVASLGLGSVAAAATCVLCGALASGAANRGAVASAVAVPLLTFLAQLGTTALLPAFGDPRPVGWPACGGLLALAAGNLSLGPGLLAAVWKR